MALFVRNEQWMLHCMPQRDFLRLRATNANGEYVVGFVFARLPISIGENEKKRKKKLLFESKKKGVKCRYFRSKTANR